MVMALPLPNVAAPLAVLQDHAHGVDAGVQLLDPPDRALCTDRRQAAAAAAVCGGHERYQALATNVLLRVPQ